MADFCFKYLQDYDASGIRDKLNSLDASDWDLFKARGVGNAHIHTKNIVARTNPKRFTKPKDVLDRWAALFEDDVDKLTVELEKHYGEIYIFSMLFAKLPAGYAVLPHVDTQPTLTGNHRIHLPIQTNDKCELLVGTEHMNLKVDTLTEIDNTDKMHMAVNNGTTDRIHAIIDLKLGNSPNMAFRLNEDLD